MYLHRLIRYAQPNIRLGTTYICMVLNGWGLARETLPYLQYCFLLITS